MPQTNETILLQAQAGLESTRGTNVAATRKVYAQITPKYERPLMKFADTSGTFEGRRRAAHARAKVGFNAVDICTYEDLPWWLQLGVAGGVAGVTDGDSPPAYTYTFTPTAAADDLKSATLEFGDSGNPYESGQVMCNSFTIRADSDNDSEPGWMIDLDLLARDWATTTFTGALTDRATEVILARGTDLYIDNAGGTIGSTAVTGKLIDFSVTVNNNIHYKSFMEDVTYVAANKVGRGERTIDAQITFEMDADGEFANLRSTSGPVQRLIRIEQSNTTVIHDTPDVYKRVRLDMYGYWETFSRGDRNGNLIMTLGFAGFYDITATKAFSFAIVNALSALA